MAQPIVQGGGEGVEHLVGGTTLFGIHEEHMEEAPLGQQHTAHLAKDGLGKSFGRKTINK
jgi:hypothetical protein